MFNLSEYQTCAERLELFWKDNPNGRIDTKLIEASPSRFIVQAFIYRDKDDQHAWASGLAEETVSGRGVNSTSALENCETSSLARALANAGYSPKGDPSKRASREEMTKVAVKANTETVIAQTKAKLAETAKEYVPVAKEDDPWTIRDAQPAATVDEAVKIVKDIIGGQTERDIPKCTKCHDRKEMTWRTGVGKNGKPYGNFSCFVCKDVVWYQVAANGTWEPQKVKW